MMPMPRTLSHPHAPILHKQFQTAVQSLNRRYANKLTPAQMATLQASTPLQPGSGMPQRTLSAAVQAQAGRGLTP